MRERTGKSTEEAIIDMTDVIDGSVKTRRDRESMTKFVLRQTHATGTATGLISFIHTGFKTHDMGGKQGIFPPANLRQRRGPLAHTDEIVTKVALASHDTRRCLMSAQSICKTGNGAGSEGRFGKKFPGASLDLPRGQGTVRDPSGIRIPQVTAAHAVGSDHRGNDRRHYAENRLAIELQNATRSTPRSGEREEQQ